MSAFPRALAILAGLCALGALLLPLGTTDAGAVMSWSNPAVVTYPALVLAMLAVFRLRPPPLITAPLALVGGFLVIAVLASFSRGAAGYWALLATVWFVSWLFAEGVSQRRQAGGQASAAEALIPALFGANVLLVWEAMVRGLQVPPVLLPPPSLIWVEIAENLPILGVDFIQTIKAVLIGYGLGCGIAFVVAIAIDRSPFLKRGLLPLGNFVSALPLIGIAPIMVMWFGFDWPSKAAVVVVMTFFPMLVNALAGLAASERIQLDLMRSYGAGYWQTLLRLRLPNALPFLFNALKINSTLALIGAIVAEFFGTPVVGMGFRISTEVARMNLGVVWASITIAAITGSVFYGGLAMIEQAATAWHPSNRRR
jgi:NitT/TauT family transport system permease protein